MSNDDVYYPLIQTPVGKVPLTGATMTVERERELNTKYGVSWAAVLQESEAAG